MGCRRPVDLKNHTTALLFPKADCFTEISRSSDFLILGAFPKNQWHKGLKHALLFEDKVTAAGTVSDLHRCSLFIFARLARLHKKLKLCCKSTPFVDFFNIIFST